MKAFWKEVIRPGKYFPRDAEGKPFEVEIKKDRIWHWAKQVKSMVDAGNRIPVPYHHTEDAVPITLDTTNNNTYDCAGYATDAEVQLDGSLHMKIEPATEADEGNFNTKIRDVSIRTRDWLDGSGNEFKDAITHVAACYHPVMNNQKPFQPTGGLALSLTMAADYTETGYGTNNSATNSLDSAVELLADLGFDIGDDVTPENFVDRLCTALRAVKSYKEQEGVEGEEEEGEKPEGSKTQKPTPIAMNLLEFSIDKVSADPKNPATGESWTADELELAYKLHEDATPKLKLSAEHQAAFDLLQSNNKKQIADRLSNCVKTMTMRQDVAEDILEAVNDVELTFSADGSVNEANHRDIFIPLKMAENTSPGAALTGMKGKEAKGTGERLKLSLHTHSHPDEFYKSDDAPVSDEEAEENAKRLLRSVGGR